MRLSFFSITSHCSQNNFPVILGYWEEGFPLFVFLSQTSSQQWRSPLFDPQSWEKDVGVCDLAFPSCLLRIHLPLHECFCSAPAPRW